MTRAFDTSPGSKSFLNIINLVISFALAAGGAYGIFWMSDKKKRFGVAYLSAIAGVFLAIFIYKWTFQLFLDNTFILLFMAVVFAAAFGLAAYLHAF